jgi:Conserved TM helix
MTVMTNWGTAILSALATAVNLILTFMPRLLGFLIILLVGWLIATAVSKALTFLLQSTGGRGMGAGPSS